MGLFITPILFESTATNFSSFGLGALAETTSCEITEEKNGLFELVLKYPTNGLLFSQISNGKIIKAKVNETSQYQAFRIYRITVPINGVITVYAQHISYDLANIGVLPFSLTNTNPSILVTKLLNDAVIFHGFSFQTDITTTNTFEITEPQNIRACLGNSKMSLLTLWDGEFEWDNFVIKFHNNRGQDNGVTISYGKNLTKLEKDGDITDVYTDLFPYAKYQNENNEDVLVTLSEKVLPITSSLTTRKNLIKDFSSSFERGTVITQEMLRTIAAQYILDNPYGVENPSISISFEPLWKMPEYSFFVEHVALCDYVTIKHPLLGISTKQQVVKVVYDCLKERYKTITLGTCKNNLLNQISNIKNDVDNTANKIKESETEMEHAIDEATKKITGNSGGCVVLHSDTTTGYPYELLVMDENSIETATKVWRWNLNGLGYSSTGYDGTYGTAITNDGKIVADYITTGTLNANIIKAGSITSLDGTSYWNVATGDISIKGNITAQSGTIGNFTIDSNSISHGTWGTDDSVLVCSGTTGSKSIGGSGNISGWAFAAGSAFGVTKDGDLYANDVHLTGDIQATSGSIDIGNGSFVVDSSGNLTATSADIEGSIIATGNNSSININNNFIVSTDGILTAKNANISGNMEVSDLSAEDINVDTITINGLKIESDNSGSSSSQTVTFDADFHCIYGPGTTMIQTTITATAKIWETTPIHVTLKGMRWDDAKCRQMYYSKTISATMLAGHNSVTNSVTIQDDSIVINTVTSIVPMTMTYTKTESYPGFMFQGNVVPYYNGGYDLGNPLKKWDDIYANNSTIQTSDRKSKKNISYDISKYDCVFDSLKPVSFKYTDGDSGRTHLGFIAQDIEQTLIETGVSSKDFACLIKSLIHEDEPNPQDKDYSYGLRLGELHALEINEIQKLKKRVAELESKLKEVTDG